MRAGALLLALAAAGPAAAQPVDCEAATLAPAELATCAEQALAEADAAMDEAFRLALTEARAFDEASASTDPEVDVPLATALEASQAAFLDYRDAACVAEAVAFSADVRPPVAGLVCGTRLTLGRTEDLRFFGEIEPGVTQRR